MTDLNGATNCQPISFLLVFKCIFLKTQKRDSGICHNSIALLWTLHSCANTGWNRWAHVWPIPWVGVGHLWHHCCKQCSFSKDHCIHGQGIWGFNLSEMLLLSIKASDCFWPESKRECLYVDRHLVPEVFLLGSRGICNHWASPALAHFNSY